MQLTCIAIDDESWALALIKEYISRMASLKLLHTFSDAIAGAAFLKATSVGLLFIDVDMPDITGIDLVRSLPAPPMIIFTTAYKHFALEGFELEAIDYLLKPLDFSRFEKAVTKAIERHQYKLVQKAGGEKTIFVRSEYQLVKIDLSEIEYIESLEDYLKIHRTRDRPVMTLMTLKAILEKLPAADFKRVHRSYVIPVSRIQAVAARKVKLTHVELPVSDSYADALAEWIKNK